MMCYTSGTTGRSKGVLYSHRSMVLHALNLALPDCLGLRESDDVLAVVPMFHVNAWGLPFTCAMLGATQVLPGPCLDAASLVELFEAERVTLAAGVPTIWHGVLNYLDEHPGHDLSSIARDGRRWRGDSRIDASCVRRSDTACTSCTPGA